MLAALLLQLAEQKARHAQEMDLVGVKLQGVLAKKDATISSQREQLEGLMQRLAAAEQELRELAA